MKKLIEQPHILLSPENPQHEGSSSLSHEDAIGILSGGGKHTNVYPIKGKYGKEENSILISNPTEAQQALAHKISEETGQDSLIESDGFSHKMITTSGPEKGKVVYGKGTVWHDEAPEDYYTTLPTGEHFTHNFGNVESAKSEDLQKSKNVRRWKEALFGTRGDPAPASKRKKTAKMVYDYGDRTETVKERLQPKTYRQAQMEALSRLSEKKLGMPVVRAKGKIVNLNTMERDPNYKGKSPKPDWRSGELESEPTSQAVSHELGHVFMLPEGISFKDAQEWMDEGSAEAGRLIDKEGRKRTGAAKQTEREVVPMGAENPIRRRAGVPSFARPQDMSSVYGESSKKKLKWSHPERRTIDTDRSMAVRIADKKGNPIDLIGLSQNLRPEDRQRMQDIDEATIQLNRKKGWIPTATTVALINLRGQGRKKEAQERLKQRYSNLSGPVEQEQEIDMQDLLDHQGSVDELKEKIKRFASQKKLAASEIDLGLMPLQKSTREYKQMLGDVSQHQEAFNVAKKMPNSNWGTWVVRNYKQDPEKFHQVKPHLEHFAGSQHIPDIAAVRFDKTHDFDSGIQQLKNAEDKYNEKIKSNTNIVKPTEGTKKILDVGNGMAWYSLGRPYCKAEGKALGHCGNEPSQQDYHDVLSLRTSHTIGGKEYHEPHLTFINDKDSNILGEMKGRANKKPAEHYHEAIAKLLGEGYVPFGGGYEIGDIQNFHIDDLSPKLKQYVLERNPEAFIRSSDKDLAAKATEGFDI